MSNTGLETIDDVQFEEMRELLDEDFTDLVKAFILDSKARVQEIQKAYAEDDNATGYDAVHALKGASANLGAPLLADLCYKLQMQCRGRNINDSRALIESIENELKAVVDQINKRLA